MTQLAKATIHGKIANSITMLPIRNVMVGDINDFSKYTDEAGEFRLPNIPIEPIPYDVRFWKAGYDEIVKSITFNVGDNDLGTILMSPTGNDDKYICQYCPQPFNTRAELEQHIIDAHTGGSYPCQMCTGVVFDTKEKLKQHIILAHFSSVEASLQGYVYAGDTHAIFQRRLSLLDGSGKLYAFTDARGIYKFEHLINSAFSGITYILRCDAGNGYAEIEIPGINLKFGLNQVDVTLERTGEGNQNDQHILDNPLTCGQVVCPTCGSKFGFCPSCGLEFGSRAPCD